MQSTKREYLGTERAITKALYVDLSTGRLSMTVITPDFRYRRSNHVYRARKSHAIHYDPSTCMPDASQRNEVDLWIYDSDLKLLIAKFQESYLHRRVWSTPPSSQIVSP